ncbi:MAG TPA: hypothetical protein V6C81_24700 [Planktothrix sp.]|jgi:hypothetical protein
MTIQRNFAPALSFVIALVSAAAAVLPVQAKQDPAVFVQNAHCGHDSSAKFYQLPPGQRKSGFGQAGIASVIQNSGETGDVAGVAFLTPFAEQGAGGFNDVVFNYQLGSGFTNSLVTFCFLQTDGRYLSITRTLDSLPEAPGQTPQWGAIVVTPDTLGVDHTVTLVKTIITVSEGKQNIGCFYVANADNDFLAPSNLKFDQPGCEILEFCSAAQFL